MSINRVQKNIMRRVYYTFGVRLATHPLVLQLVVLGLALWALAQLVFVSRVVEGFLNTRVGDIVPHALNVLGQADTLTLLVFGIFVFTLLSVGVQFRMPRWHWRKVSAI